MVIDMNDVQGIKKYGPTKSFCRYKDLIEVIRSVFASFTSGYYLPFLSVLRLTEHEPWMEIEPLSLLRVAKTLNKNSRLKKVFSHNKCSFFKAAFLVKKSQGKLEQP